MEMLVYVTIGLFGGILSGLMGVGGGLILIPLMLIFLKMTQHQAQGTSLAVICLSFISAFVYYKKGYVNLAAAALIGIGFVIGSFVSSHFAVAISDQILKKCFAILMIIIAVKMLFFK
jgi:uncharacterized membrane protein YfcA